MTATAGQKSKLAETLARLYVLVADTHQNDYDWQQHLVDLEKTLKLRKEARAQGRSDTYINECAESYHRASLRDIADKVCADQGESDLGRVVYLGLSSAWNDVLEWSALQVKGLDTTTPAWRTEWEAKMENLYKEYA